MKRTLAILTTILLLVYAAVLATAYDPLWVIVMISTAIAFGSVSSLVAVRRLYFLAGASPHSALFAVTLSIPLAYYTMKGGEIVYSMLTGLILIYLVGYSIYKGLNTDIATSVFVGFTAAGSVISAYYVLTNFPIEFDLSSIILGDPLLVTFEDVLLSIIIAAAAIMLVSLTYREQLSIGIDRDSAALSGINIRLYDFIVFTLLGVTMIGMLRVAGYILEHILVLLPASISISAARSAYQALMLSILTALASALIGLHLGLIFNITPSGLTGAVLIIYYILSLWGKRR